jgi:hypothetical protein
MNAGRGLHLSPRWLWLIGLLVRLGIFAEVPAKNEVAKVAAAPRQPVLPPPPASRFEPLFEIRTIDDVAAVGGLFNCHIRWGKA